MTHSPQKVTGSLYGISYRLNSFKGIIKPNEANCLDPEFGLDYCGDDDEDPATTLDPLTGTTEPATWPTLMPTTMEMDTTTTH